MPVVPDVTFREAMRDEVAAVVALLRDDRLGSGRERAPLDDYLNAFDRMQDQGGNSLIVGLTGGRVVACYQLMILHGVSLQASTRAQIEGVRVASELRGQGVGGLLIKDAMARARVAGAVMMQLTMNQSREQSHRFYESHGFEATHVGFKRRL